MKVNFEVKEDGKVDLTISDVKVSQLKDLLTSERAGRASELFRSVGEAIAAAGRMKEQDDEGGSDNGTE